MPWQNPYNFLNFQGVSGARIQALPQNYHFELTMDTWWSAVQRARLFSDFTGLDALYSYVLKSSTLVRSAVDKRLRPLKSRTFAVYIGDKEDERLTKRIADEPFIRELIYQKGLSNFTYARVVGVGRDMGTYIYPLRNLDTVNRAVRKMTYNIGNIYYVRNHVNLFWMQTPYHSEDTLGLLEPVCRDYINMCNAQNNWQTASQFLAYQQMMMYFENGDEKMEEAAQIGASQVGLGKVIISGKSTDEQTGKVIKDLELENVYGGASADTFRIFKENIEQLRSSIMQLILGSSLLGMSEKNTNSERLVRAHLKLFRDITEADAIDVQDWFNIPENRVKIAYLLDEPDLARSDCKFRVKPANYIDIGDIEAYTKMLKDLNMTPTEGFVVKTGLSVDDVKLNENVNETGTGGQGAGDIRENRSFAGRIKDMALDFTKRLYHRS